MPSTGAKKLSVALYLFVGHEYWGTNRIARVTIDTFTLKDYLEVPITSVVAIYGLVKDGNYLYACDYDIPAHITKIDLSTWSVIATLTLESGENQIGGACKVGNYLYVGCYVSPGKIVKIDLSTFTRVGSLTLETGENNLWDVVSDDSYLYAICVTAPTKIVKIDLSMFTRVGALTLNGAPEYEYYGGKSRIYGGKLYVPVGYQKYAPPPIYVSRLVKVDLESFTREASLLLGSYIYEVAACCSPVKDNFIYVACDGVNKIYKVNLETFEVVSSLDPGVRSCDDLHIEGNYLYAVDNTYNLKGIVKKIDLATFTVVGTCITWDDIDAIATSITS